LKKFYKKNVIKTVDGLVKYSKKEAKETLVEVLEIALKEEILQTIGTE